MLAMRKAKSVEGEPNKKLTFNKSQEKILRNNVHLALSAFGFKVQGTQGVGKLLNIS